MDATELELVQIGLSAGESYSLALAGGLAFVVHGFLQRPTEDIDLFADWTRREEFPAAVEAVVAAYQDAGYGVEVEKEFEGFRRLLVSRSSGKRYKVELVANWREQTPVLMDVGPVLHPDDIMAGKVDASSAVRTHETFSI